MTGTFGLLAAGVAVGMLAQGQPQVDTGKVGMAHANDESAGDSNGSNIGGGGSLNGMHTDGAIVGDKANGNTAQGSSGGDNAGIIGGASEFGDDDYNRHDVACDTISPWRWTHHALRGVGRPRAAADSAAAAVDTSEVASSVAVPAAEATC